MPDFAKALDCAESPDFAEELNLAACFGETKKGPSPEEPSSLLLNFTKATYGTSCSPHPVAAHGSV